MKPVNLVSNLPARGLEEDVLDLLHRPGVRIERIVSHGHASPADFWYDQDEDEWVVLLQGLARLEVQDGEAQSEKTIELTAGDSLLIPAHQRHRVAWTTPNEPTIWLAVFLVPA